MIDALQHIRIAETCLKICFGGNVQKMAEAFGVSRQTIYHWLGGVHRIKGGHLGLMQCMLVYKKGWKAAQLPKKLPVRFAKVKNSLKKEGKTFETPPIY